MVDGDISRCTNEAPAVAYRSGATTPAASSTTASKKSEGPISGLPAGRIPLLGRGGLRGIPARFRIGRKEAVMADRDPAKRRQRNLARAHLRFGIQECRKVKRIQTAGRHHVALLL